MSFDIINNLLHDDEGKMKKIPQENHISIGRCPREIRFFLRE